MKKKKLTEVDIFKILKKFTIDCVHGGDYDQGQSLSDTLSILKSWWSKQSRTDPSDFDLEFKCIQCGKKEDEIDSYI